MTLLMETNELKPAERQWNFRLWLGFALVAAGLFGYFLIFVRFPITRDFPWASLLLFAAGLLLLAQGWSRAIRQPAQYRGKIAAPILALVSLGIIGFFSFGLFVVARQLPGSNEATAVGARAPEFSLTNQVGKLVSLADFSGSRGTLLIFYRGHW